MLILIKDEIKVNSERQESVSLQDGRGNSTLTSGDENLSTRRRHYGNNVANGSFGKSSGSRQGSKRKRNGKSDRGTEKTDCKKTETIRGKLKKFLPPTSPNKKHMKKATKPAKELPSQGRTIAMVKTKPEDFADGNSVYCDDTPLHRAVLENCTQYITDLIHDQGCIDISNAAGYTALMYACIRNLRGICQMLLVAGAKVDIRNKAGETALHIAINSGQYDKNDCLKLLLRYGPNVTIQDQHGLTALHLLMLQPDDLDLDHIGIMCPLIREGASMHAKCILKEVCQGRPTDPFQLAVATCHIEAIVLLAEAGYTVPKTVLHNTHIWHGHPDSKSDKVMSVLYKYLKVKSNNPQTLRVLCRSRIRANVRQSNELVKLGLPKILTEYLRYPGLENVVMRIVRSLKDDIT